MNIGTSKPYESLALALALVTAGEIGVHGRQALVS